MSYLTPRLARSRLSQASCYVFTSLDARHLIASFGDLVVELTVHPNGLIHDADVENFIDLVRSVQDGGLTTEFRVVA